MKLSSHFLVSVLFLAGIVTSCSEFIERSIEDKKVFLNAPADSAESGKYLQSFWWEPVDDALSYRLQIVSPSFNQAQQLILDSVIKDNKFSFTLEPGEYQWRVRGENGSSQTFYTTRTFFIYETDLSKQQVQLKGPPNGVITNQRNFITSWYSMYSAAGYLLQVDSTAGNFTDEPSLFVNTIVANTEYAVTATSDKTYSWRVKAKNDTSESKWSAVYRFTFDGTAPGKVVLGSPANGSGVSKPVTLQWNVLADAKKYLLYILKSDSTAYNSSYPLTLTTNSYSFNGGETNEKILWKVKAVDAAGNIGADSEVRNFTVQ
ncbi:hypothetical protein [Arcticibacter tournemirensis]